MQQAVEDRDGEGLVARKDLRPVMHGFVRGERHRAALVLRRNGSKDEICFDTVERTDADFVGDGNPQLK